MQQWSLNIYKYFELNNYENYNWQRKRAFYFQLLLSLFSFQYF